MAKFFGCKPATPTRQAVEKFENEVMIRKDNRLLVGTVYLDIQDTAWAVAVAYNQSRAPGLHGHENLLEVRYTYTPAEKGYLNMFRSDPGTVTALGAGPFTDTDNFVKYALDYERGIVNHDA